jgi:hypothetical protein
MESAAGGGPPTYSAAGGEAGFEAAMRPWLRYQEIVDNALVATGAQLAMLARFDPETGAVRTVGWAGLQAPAVQRALASARRLLPQLDPRRVTTHADVNPFQRAIYREAKAAAGSLFDVAAGVVDDRVLQIADTVIGVRHAFVCPLVAGRRVEGSLSVFTPTPATPEQQRTCEAFAREVALTLENARLLEALQAQMDDARQAARVEARLEGITLAAREMGHLLNNALVVPVGLVELLQGYPGLPQDVRELVDLAAADLAMAEQYIEQFQQVVRVETKQTPVGPALDLARSTTPHRPPESSSAVAE